MTSMPLSVLENICKNVNKESQESNIEKVKENLKKIKETLSDRNSKDEKEEEKCNITGKNISTQNQITGEKSKKSTKKTTTTQK